MYKSVEDLIDTATARRKPVSDLMIEQEMHTTGLSHAEVWKKMERNLEVMKNAVEKGSNAGGVYSKTGLTGGDAAKIKEYRETHHSLSGDAVMAAVQGAIATNEVNAAMGIICATPTAGSSGTLPGILFMLKKRINLSHEQEVRFLFTAGAYGLVIANNACIAGASGGCQAEVGSASAMGAAAAVEVAGLVEVPCVKRNAIGATNALVAADMALAGCTSRIPVDEVISAMNKVGHSMSSALRETGQGGLAGTKTGKMLRHKLFHEV